MEGQVPQTWKQYHIEAMGQQGSPWFLREPSKSASVQWGRRTREHPTLFTKVAWE